MQLAAEVLELFQRDAPFEKRARVDTGRPVSLEEDDVAFVAVLTTAEEVVERHLVQRRGRGERRDVAADAVLDAIRAHDHGHRVPAHQALDPALDLAAAGVRHFLGRVNGIDVWRVGGERQLDALLGGVHAELPQQAADARRPSMLQNVVE